VPRAAAPSPVQEAAIRTLARLAAAIAAATFLFLGLWAYLAPGSFGAGVADYPPYNEHYLRDGGAFQVGLGTAALAGLVIADPLTAVLTGAAAASLLHAAAHLAGGSHTDDRLTLSTLALTTLLGLTAAIAATRRTTATRRTAGDPVPTRPGGRGRP